MSLEDRHDPRSGVGFACGKVILFGEHAVVHGRPALAAGLQDGMQAELRPVRAGEGQIRCSEWALAMPLEDSGSLGSALRAVLGAAGLAGTGWDVELTARLPPSAGLGSSAATCVAVARAAADWLGRALSDEEAAALAFEGERCFHGTPSGIDNTVAAFGGLLWFQRPALRRRVSLGTPLHLVVGQSGEKGETAAQVALVQRGAEAEPERFSKLFDEIAALVEAALEAIAGARLEELGRLMTANHSCLQQLGVSSVSLDAIVRIALDAGALGAKLTGAGGGGCAIALASAGPAAEHCARALRRHGYTAFTCEIRAES